MNRICLMVCLTLLFSPLVVHAEEPVQYQIDARFVACPTNEAAETSTPTFWLSNVDPAALPTNWDVLSTPTIIIMSGQEAVIRVSEKPTQYFVKQSDGSFQLHQMDPQHEPGLGLTVTVTSEDNNGIVTIKAKIEFSSIQKRVEIPGVALDVGPPVVTSHIQQFNSALKLGAWMVSSLSGYVSPDPNNSNRAILVLMRVRRVKAFDASGRPIVE
jgi:hypothetical protein